MRNLILFSFIYAITPSQVDSQSTRDIIVTAEITNPKNNTAVRIIRNGEILSNTGNNFDTQVLSIYDVFPQDGIVQAPDGNWLLTIQPRQTVRFRVGCRCLNKGLKVPKPADIVPTNTVFSTKGALTTQDSTWKTIEHNKNIVKYHCAKIIKGQSCDEGLISAAKEIFRDNGILVNYVNHTPDAEGNIFSIESVTSLNIPVKLVNIKHSCVERDTTYDTILQGDIFIENKYHTLFGKL